jgi:hypothetical protein
MKNMEEEEARLWERPKLHCKDRRLSCKEAIVALS